jgi:hypothetical protein
MTTRRCGKDVWRVLMNRTAAEGRASMLTINYDVFERAILSQLAELDPNDVLPPDTTPDAVAIAANEVEWVRERIDALRAELVRGGPVAAVVDAIRDLETQQRALMKRAEDATENAAVPIRQSWATARTLIGMLTSADDPTDTRLRIRAALRRVVETIEVKFIGHGRDRVAFVRVHIRATGNIRGYLILLRPPVTNRYGRKPGRWWCRSVGGARGFDAGGPITVPSRTPIPADFLKRFARDDGQLTTAEIA